MGIFDDGTFSIYPDRLHRPRGLAPQVEVFAIGPLVPIPTPAPPTELTWLPHYPDRTYRAGRVWPPPALFRWPMVPIANTEWGSVYPSRLRRKVLPIADMPAWFGVLGVQSAIAQGMFWAARYPSILRRTKTVPPSQSVYPIQPSVIIATATCVEWSETSLLRPVIDAESVVRPAFTCDVHEIGYLLLEDGGFLLLEDGGKIELEDQTTCTQEACVRPIMAEESVC